MSSEILSLEKRLAKIDEFLEILSKLQDSDQERLEELCGDLGFDLPSRLDDLIQNLNEKKEFTILKSELIVLSSQLRNLSKPERTSNLNGIPIQNVNLELQREQLFKEIIPLLKQRMQTLECKISAFLR